MEYASWRAAQSAAEAAHRKLDPAVLAKRREAGEQLAVLEPLAERAIQESSALARAAEAATAYSDAMWTAENARLRVANGPANAVLSKSGPEYVEALDRLIAATGAWVEAQETILADISIPRLLDPFRFEIAEMDRLTEALARHQVVTERTRPQTTGPEVQASLQDLVEVLVALTNEALAQTASAAAERNAAREAWGAAGTEAVVVFEASELAEREALERLKMAAPAAWAAFETATLSQQ